MAFPGGHIQFAKKRSSKFSSHVSRGGFHVSGISGGLEKNTRAEKKKAEEEAKSSRRAKAAAQAKKAAEDAAADDARGQGFE